MSRNIILLYNKNKNNFEDMLKNNLVNPKILMEQNNLGETVLHHLIKSNDNKCVENVLNFVKDNLSRTEKQKFIDTQDENGNTAFHLATQKRAFEIATLLDIYGANKKIPNNNNEIIDVDTDFTDSSDQINCGDKQKINKLVHNIIKPNKNYNNFSEELNLVQQNNKKMLSEKEEDWPKTLDEVNETDNNTNNSLSIELENLILSENRNKKSKRENNLTESFDDIILSKSDKSKSDSNKKKNIINSFFDNFFNTSGKQTGGQKSESPLSDASSTINLNENMSEFETSTSEFLKYIDNKINQQGGRRSKASSNILKGKSKSKSKSRNIESLSSSFSSSSSRQSDDNRSSSKSSVSSFSSDLSSLDSVSSFNSKSSDLSSLGSNSSLSDLDMISLSSFNFLQTRQKSNLEGGAKKKQTKKTKKTKRSKGSKYSVSREFSKADEIHKEVIKMIQDLGYSEQEAKIIKAGLYTYTKEKHPELTNYERSVKMRAYTTQQHIANLDINAIKQAIETHFANKQKDTDKKM